MPLPPRPVSHDGAALTPRTQVAGPGTAARPRRPRAGDPQTVASDPPAAPVGRSAPILIPPHAVFTRESAQRLLGLPRSTLPREVRLGRLRVARRAGKYLILGEWLTEWIRGGELRPNRDSAPA